MTKISAEVVADSICNGHRITTMKVVMPRIVLAEAKTHRVMKRTDEGMEVYDIPGIGFNDDEMLSRNSASSRAIPFEKMVKVVMEDPFIPIAWQKDHKGMQGTEYMTTGVNDLIDNHLRARDAAVERAREAHERGATKQYCNRLLEPFMWHTVLVTATEWENFFHLRCPQYYFNDDCKNKRSRKEVIEYCKTVLNYDEATLQDLSNQNDLWWLGINKGQAEIHMMALAEAMWDARNESKPKELQPGEWHIPYCPEFLETNWQGQKTQYKPNPLMQDETMLCVKIATALCAQTSYTVVGEDGKPTSQENLLDLHNSLLVRPHTNRKGVVFGPDDPKHMSPAEHCAQAMTELEITANIKGCVDTFEENDGDIGIHERYRIVNGEKTRLYYDDMFGWCHNFRGWKSYRSMIPNENRR